MPKLDRPFSLPLTIFGLLFDAFRFIRLSLQPRCILAAENLFLRKQLALYLERQDKPRRAETAAKMTLVLLSRLFPWRQALTIAWRSRYRANCLRRKRFSAARIQRG